MTKMPCIRVCFVSMTLAVSGCVTVDHRIEAKGEAPVIQGPAARDNKTPLEDAYICMAARLAEKPDIGISVGNIKDYTGKYSDQEGSVVTQGGALMVISALGKLGNSIRIHERYDNSVPEQEWIYIQRQQLGDGQVHEINGQKVPWEPYMGGQILGSDYFIVGGITELNYNIQSGGAEFAVSMIGPKARTFTMNVAADLRIVDTRSLVVKDTVSLQKQITGYEVGLGVFSFFGDTLVEINAGAKNQEPLQLGIRTVLELGTLELVSHIYGFDPLECIAPVEEPAPEPEPEPAEVYALPEPFVPPSLPEPLVAEADMVHTVQ